MGQETEPETESENIIEDTLETNDHAKADEEPLEDNSVDDSNNDDDVEFLIERLLMGQKMKLMEVVASAKKTLKEAKQNLIDGIVKTKRNLHQARKGWITYISRA